MIRFSCPRCKQVLQAPPERAGARVACSACKAVMVVPAPAGPASPPPPVAPPPVVPPPELSVPLVRDNLAASAPDAPPSPPLLSLRSEPLPPATPPEARALGEPMASLRWGYRYGYMPLFVGGGVVVLGALSCSLSALLTLFSKHPQENDSFGFVCCALLLALAGALAAYALLSMRFNPLTVLWICPGGLIRARRGAVTSCRWDEVEEFRAQAALVTNVRSGQVRYYYSFDLTWPGGEKLTLGQAQARMAAKTFGDHIQQETTRALLPVFHRRLARGETLDFAPFHLSPDGISHGGQSAAWGELSHCTVSAGMITFYRPGDQRWVTEQVGRVSHVLVMLSLLEGRLAVR